MMLSVPGGIQRRTKGVGALQGKQKAARIKAAVQKHYGTVARGAAVSSQESCCGAPFQSTIGNPIPLYDEEELKTLPSGAVMASRGSGNPIAYANVQPGEVVLDLGSGGGIDVFLAARKVGPKGKVYGLDLTEEMLELARKNQEQAGMTNVEFLKGDMEQIPLPGHHVDVIVSNCVINLAADKQAVFQEAFRVLKPGGRLAVADPLFDGGKDRLSPAFLAESWCNCLGGALEVSEFKTGLREAGFREIHVHVLETQDIGSPQTGEPVEDDDAGTNKTNSILTSVITAGKPEHR